MRIRKPYILIIILIHFILFVDGQEIKSKSKCDLISILINSDQKWLRLPKNPTDSTVNFLDPEHLLDSCHFTYWRGFKVNIIRSGILIDSIHRYELHFVTQFKPSYYAIRESKSTEYWGILFQRGYDNIFVQATLRKKHGYYYMGKIKAGVE